MLTALMLLGFAASPVAAQHAAAECRECGSVTGRVSVSRTSIRTEGPKHDRDVVVVLERIGGSAFPLSSNRTEMDQQGLVFIPHTLAIEKGTTVTFLNNDTEQHNVYFLNDRTGETLDIGTWGQGVSVDHRFTEPGTVITLCKLHLEMAAYIVVLDSPWFTVTELDSSNMQGEFTLGDLPPGEYELSVWHKKLKQKGGPVRVSVEPGTTTEVDVAITKAKYAMSPD